MPGPSVVAITLDHTALPREPAIIPLQGAAVAFITESKLLASS